MSRPSVLGMGMPEAARMQTVTVSMSSLPLPYTSNKMHHPCPSSRLAGGDPLVLMSHIGAVSRAGDFSPAISGSQQLPAYYTPPAPVQPTRTKHRRLGSSARLSTAATASAVASSAPIPATSSGTGSRRGGGGGGQGGGSGPGSAAAAVAAVAAATASLELASPSTTRLTGTQTSAGRGSSRGERRRHSRVAFESAVSRVALLGQADLAAAALTTPQSRSQSPPAVAADAGLLLRCSPTTTPPYSPPRRTVEEADHQSEDPDLAPSTMCQLLPPETTLRAVLGAVAAAGVTVEKQSEMPRSPTRTQRIYDVALSDGRRLLLVMAPPSMLRLLRSERSLVESEAAVVRWVRDVLTREKLAVRKVLNLDGATAPCSSSSTAPSRHPSVEPREPNRDPKEDGSSKHQHQHQHREHNHSHSHSHSCDYYYNYNNSGTSSSNLAPSTQSWPPPDPDLLALLPPLLFSSTTAGTSTATAAAQPPIDSPCAVFGQSQSPPSVPAALLRLAMTPSECKLIDFQAGRLARRLSCLTSPSRRFGPAVAVLPSPDAGHHGGNGPVPSRSPSPAVVDGTGRLQTPPPFLGGAGTWSMAFHNMLEGVLRDAEDMTINIPYTSIRKHFRRLGHLLDTVRIPRLVLVDGAAYSNVLVSTRAPTATPGDSASKLRGTHATVTPVPTPQPAGGTRTKGATSSPEVTGLADWSNCVFGDPLFMRIFSEKPSAEFLRGFHGGRQHEDNSSSKSSNIRVEDNDKTTTSSIREYAIEDHGDFYYNDPMVEDREMSAIRLLIYQSYHYTVSIVTEFYRPSDGGSEREMDARKKLNSVLGRLAKVDDDPKRRHRRPSGDMSPAKKPKQDE